MTRGAENEDKRRNPVKRLTSTRSEEALLEARRRARRRKYVKSSCTRFAVPCARCAMDEAQRRDERGGVGPR